MKLARLIAVIIMSCISVVSVGQQPTVRVVPPVEYVWAHNRSYDFDFTLYKDATGGYWNLYFDYPPGLHWVPVPIPSYLGGFSLGELAARLCNDLNANVDSLNDAAWSYGWPAYDTYCRNRGDPTQIYRSGSDIQLVGVCPWTGPYLPDVGCQAGTCDHPEIPKWVNGGFGRTACYVFNKPDPNKNAGPPGCNLSGGSNPINGGTGNKYEEMTDLRMAGPMPLEFVLSYNSDASVSSGLIGNWRHTYQREVVAAVGTNGLMTSVRRPTGRTEVFFLNAGAYLPDADVQSKLNAITSAGTITGWQYVGIDNAVESYDAAGHLLSIASPTGLTQTMSYSTASTPSSVAPTSGLLINVSDTFGRTLRLTYNSAGRIASVQPPDGQIYSYSYDSLNRLTTVAFPDGKSRTYLYNEPSYTANTVLPNALTGVIDEVGIRFASFYYDTQGRAIRSEHAGGVSGTSFVYSDAPQQTQITDANGTVRTFSMTTILGKVKNTGIDRPGSGCDVPSSATVYDTQGNTVSRTDFNGNSVCSSFDLTRNLETARAEGVWSNESCAAALTTLPSRPDVRKISTQWHGTWRQPIKLAEPGRLTTWVFNGDGGNYCAPTSALVNAVPIGVVCSKTVQGTNDSSGQQGLSPTTIGIPRTWMFTYDKYGHVLTATDPNGKVTTYSYYSNADANLGKRGNVQSITNPLGHVTQITAYDANARPLTTVDPNGLTTTLTYDARGRLINRNVGGEQTTYFYDGVGQLTQVVLPDFSTLNYMYDAAHRLTKIQDGLGNKIVYTLDAMGNRTGEQAFDPGNALARTRTRAYDSLNRLAQDIGAQSQTTAYAYDSNGNVKSVTDPLTHATGNSYDALNRLVQVLDPAGGTTQYAYDPAGNLAQVTDPRGLATTYTYDGLGNLTKQVSPDTGTTTSTFDAAGNVLTKVDARGAIATYTVDALNRVASVAYSKSGTSTETHTYTYDSGANAKGRLSQLVDTAATTAWTYTPLGRVASKSQTMSGVAHTLTYGYNSYGQLTSVTTPSGQVIGYAYSNNRVSGVTVNGSALVSGVTTFPFGAAAGWQWGNAEFTFRRFDADGRLASWEFRNGVSVLRNDLSFDTASRITALADPNLPANSGAYQYDALDRLTVAQQGSPVTHTQQFAYDALGNRQNVTIDGSLANLYYGSNSNQLQQIVGFVSPAYLGGATALTYTYNNANRLVQVQSSGTTLATYKVNGLGQRVQKVVGAATTRFVYDEHGRLLGEYDGTGKLIQETVWLDDLPVATLRPTGTNGTPTPITVYYVHADHLASPRAVTRPSDNAIMWRWDNVDPFGANTPNENPSGLGTFKYALRFPGQYYDVETGTHYNYFRDYDPTIGRYEQSDPIGLWGTVSTFAYAAGSPVRRSDRKGLWPYFGFWCGPDWTGGRKGPYVPGPGYRDPIDDLDEGCKRHDICYFNCRNSFPCSSSSRGSCMTACDRSLADDAMHSGSWFDSPLWWWMAYNNSPDTGPDDPSCADCSNRPKVKPPFDERPTPPTF